MSATRRCLVLVDGSSYLYRAFHAMPSLTNSKGDPTGAAYGMTNMLKRLETEVAPELAAVIFDAKGKTFRDDLYPEYKANRAPMPMELRAQLQSIHALVRALGFPVLEVGGVEADDVIGTLAELGKKAGLDVLVSTGDKDMAQLVDDHVTMVNTMDGAVLDAAGVEAKFGVPPESIVDYLTLMGDAVDNVPGVPKVGPKTAVKWLAQYRTVEDVVEHAGEIKGKVGENLRASLDQIPLSKELVTIRRDVPLEVGPLDLELCEPDTEALKTLYGELEFRTWLGELLDAGGDAPVEAPAAHYETVLDEAALDAWIQRLGAAEAIAFDTETTSLDYMQADLVGVSFAVEPGHAAYVPFSHDYTGAPDQLGRQVVLEKLRPILESARPAKIGQNLKYDMSVLARAGIALNGIGFDTMLESYVLDSTATRHDMDSLALKYLGHRTIHYEDIAGKGARQLTFNQIPIEDAGPYAAEDADVTLRLHRALRPRLEEHASLAALCDAVEVPLVPVLSRIERNGVRIDVRLLNQQSAELAERMREIESSAHESAGGPFNLGSAKQIRTILFDQLGLPVRAKTPKGQPSTAESVLQELAFDHELPKLILEHRAMSKLKSTYTDALPACVNPATGRVHTSYHQAVASTGRLSSSDPNLQNIPVRTHEGRRIRQAFVADPGFRLVAADYSQIELRIMAHLSGDEGLLEAFASRSRHPPGDRGRGIRGRGRGGHRRAAAQRQGHQLRPDLRHVGVRARPPARHRARGSAELRRALFLPLPGGQGVHGRHPRECARPGIRRDGLRPPPVPAGDQVEQRPPPPVRGADRDQRPDAGHRGRHHQARDAGPRCMDCRKRGTGADDHAGARRAGVRGGARGGRRLHPAHPRAYGRRGGAGGAAGGRRR